MNRELRTKDKNNSFTEVGHDKLEVQSPRLIEVKHPVITFKQQQQILTCMKIYLILSLALKRLAQ